MPGPKLAPQLARAVLQFGSIGLVMSAEDAALILPVLCRAELVKHVWDNGYHWKPNTDDSDMPTARPFSIAEYAAMHLDTDN